MAKPEPWSATSLVEPLGLPPSRTDAKPQRSTRGFDPRVYSAYETGGRQVVEAVPADDFAFSSPSDPHLDRAQYFERCWLNNASAQPGG
jgi:hypothetical protein